MAISGLVWTLVVAHPLAQPLTACTCLDGATRVAPPFCAPWLAASAAATSPAVADAGPVPTPTPSVAQEVERLMTEMTAAYSKVRDYTAILHKRERVKGKLLPTEEMAVKFRKPYSVYIKWVGEVNRGQETIYVRGANDGKLRAHRGSFPTTTIDLKPNSGIAMTNNRHPVTEASLGFVIDLITKNLDRGQRDPRGPLVLTDAGESTRFGQRVRCIDAVFPGADYYGKRARVCVFVESRLLSRIQIWDQADRLIEDYEYEKLRTNVGLSARDFDSANPSYNF